MWSKHLPTQSLRGVLSSAESHRAQAVSSRGRNVSRDMLVYDHISKELAYIIVHRWSFGPIKVQRRLGNTVLVFTEVLLQQLYKKKGRCVFSTFCTDPIPKLKSNLHTPYKSQADTTPIPQMHNLLLRVEMACHVIGQTVNK